MGISEKIGFLFSCSIFANFGGEFLNLSLEVYKVRLTKKIVKSDAREFFCKVFFKSILEILIYYINRNIEKKLLLLK